MFHEGKGEGPESDSCAPKQRVGFHPGRWHVHRLPVVGLEGRVSREPSGLEEFGVLGFKCLRLAVKELSPVVGSI